MKVTSNIYKKFIALLPVFMLSACGGSGSEGSSESGTADSISINGTTYTESSTITIDGYLDQTNSHGITTNLKFQDKTSGTAANFYLWVADAIHLDGIYNLTGTGTLNDANMLDKSSGALVYMSAPVSTTPTGGSVTVHSFTAVGQPITGSYNLNMCNTSATCATSVKNYTGDFSITATSNLGSAARPFAINSTSLASNTSYPHSITTNTGKNYYAISTNTTGGTLTIKLQPSLSPAGDVDLAVYSDATFTSPATCNITSTLNVTGTGVETCAISVAANQKVYFSVSQKAGASVFETYGVSAGE